MCKLSKVPVDEVPSYTHSNSLLVNIYLKVRKNSSCTLMVKQATLTELWSSKLNKDTVAKSVLCICRTQGVRNINCFCFGFSVRTADNFWNDRCFDQDCLGLLLSQGIKGALSRGSAGYEAVEKFTHCCPSSSPWISSILGHPTLKPTRMLSFLPEHH